MLLFSTYSTLKVRTFIMLNMFHNSTCKRQMSSTVLKSDYVTFGAYRTFKVRSSKRMKPFIIAFVEIKYFFEDKRAFYRTIMIGFLVIRRNSIEFIYSTIFGSSDESKKYVCFISTSN